MFKSLKQIAHEMKSANDIKEKELYLRRAEPWLFAGSHHGYPDSSTVTYGPGTISIK